MTAIIYFQIQDVSLKDIHCNEMKIGCREHYI